MSEYDDLKAQKDEIVTREQKPLIQMQKTLEGIRSLLETSPVECLGVGDDGKGITWPIRDEVIDNINKALSSARQEVMNK